MGAEYLMDTNTVIDFFNAKLPMNARKMRANVEPNISVITHIELFSSSKVSQEELLQLKHFVAIAKIYETIDIDIVEQNIRIRQRYKIKTPDAIIAATAMVFDLILITRNSTDFNNIEG
jgi:predicted nucleic acid-binding protein